MAESESQPIGDVALAREFFRFFGGTKGTRVLGWLMVYGLVGRRTANEILAELEVTRPDRVTQWRVFRDLVAFGAELRRQGWDLGDVDEDVAPLAREILDAVDRLRVGGVRLAV